MELLKQSDIVVTNPPFSLFREYVAQLVEYDKKFLIIGNIGAVSYKEIFPLIKEDKMWLGNGFYAGNAYFSTPNVREFASGVYDEKTGLVKFRNCHWFTNLDHGRRHQPLQPNTMAENCKHNNKVVKSDTAYKKYDNYDAIEVPFTDAIPCDYDGVMGVPISFLDKYNKEQFEIIGITKPAIDPGLRTKIYGQQEQIDSNGKRSNVTKLNDGAVLEVTQPTSSTYYVVEGKYYIQLYSRILIKHRKAAA